MTLLRQDRINVIRAGQKTDISAEDIGLPLAATADGLVRVVDASVSGGAAYYDVLSRPPVKSGKYITTPCFASVNTGTFSAGHIYFAPILVKKRQTFTDLGFGTVAVTSASIKVGVYADNGSGQPTGAPVTNSTGTVSSVTTASATAQNITFGTPITLTPGWYWLAMLSDTTGTFTSTTSGLCQITGRDDLTSSNGTRYDVTGTYASGLIDVTSSSITDTSGSAVPFMGLKVQ